MFARRSLEKLLLLAALLACLQPNSVASADENKPVAKEEKAAGILIDRKGNSILVKVDGEDEPVKFLIGNGSDKKLADALRPIFSVSRVQLTYKTDGDSKQLASIKRQVPKASGTVVGVVVKNYGWWIEVKPRYGVSDGYAVHFPFDKHQDMMDKVKGLQEGDSVSLRFTTDFERHRIETLTVQKKADSGQQSSGAGQPNANNKP